MLGAAVPVLPGGARPGSVLAVEGGRAATVHDQTSARLAREHNDANVLCIGERLTGVEVAKDALDAWLDAEFQGGRHTARVAKIEAISRHRTDA